MTALRFGVTATMAGPPIGCRGSTPLSLVTTDDLFTNADHSTLRDYTLLILALLSGFGADVMARARRARGTHVVGDGDTRFP